MRIDLATISTVMVEEMQEEMVGENGELLLPGIRPQNDRHHRQYHQIFLRRRRNQPNGNDSKCSLHHHHPPSHAFVLPWHLHLHLSPLHLPHHHGRVGDETTETVVAVVVVVEDAAIPHRISMPMVEMHTEMLCQQCGHCRRHYRNWQPGVRIVEGAAALVVVVSICLQ